MEGDEVSWRRTILLHTAQHVQSAQPVSHHVILNAAVLQPRLSPCSKPACRPTVRLSRAAAQQRRLSARRWTRDALEDTLGGVTALCKL